jgi:hypothetical protein
MVGVAVSAAIMFAFQFMHVAHYKDLRFKIIYFALYVLVVIFNTSSESPTYIIAFPMVCVCGI